MMKVLLFYAHFLNKRTVIKLKLLFFILSYLVGGAVLLFDSEHIFIYLFLLFLYLSLTDYFAPMFHRVLVIDPLVLSYSSVLIFSLLESRGELVFVQYVVMVFFLFLYHRLRGKIQKERNEKEDVTIHFYVKRLLLPLVYPVAGYFAFHFFLQEQLTLSLYWFFYFLVMMYFTKYIQTIFYFGYYTISQLAILAYLFQFMDNMFVGEKVLLYVFLLLTTTGRYLYTRTGGGETNVPFVQVLFRKNIQKSENRSRLRERH